MSDLYESAKTLSEYLLFHFAADDEILPPGRPWPGGMREALGFPTRTPRHFSNDRAARGLDLGCAVGRSTFEMARLCGEVVGIDYSHAFIDAANRLLMGEALDYRRLEEAAIETPLVARAPEGLASSSIRFMQGDAMALPDIGSFERVHAANLLCRLSDPARLLERLPVLVSPGGELVLATPGTWLEEFTPRGNWPSSGTFEWLKRSLQPAFSLQKTVEEPFLIRETARKFQWTTSLVTVWRREALGA